MSRGRVFSFLDGREVEAVSPLDFFEKLRRSERVPPGDLARYLDLIRSRGLLGFGVQLDVGAPGTDIESRCGTAFWSLASQGWLRQVSRDESREPA